MPFDKFSKDSKNKDTCKLKIKTGNTDIGQLRLDFVHFSLVMILLQQPLSSSMTYFDE
jgi:hypothetical protein